ncbi:unnamed protein product [Ectocarpus sp. 4 AP-2014]
MQSDQDDTNDQREDFHPGPTPPAALTSVPPGASTTGETFRPPPNSSRGLPIRSRPPPDGTVGAPATAHVHPRNGLLDPNATRPTQGLRDVSPRPLNSQRPSMEGRRPTSHPHPPSQENTTAGTGNALGSARARTDAAASEGRGNFPSSSMRGAVASRGTGGGGFLRSGRLGGGEYERDRENKVRQGSPVPLPKGMTGELMRQVAALDVTRMSCEQITEWFASEDTAGKMQHRVLGVNGKDLLRALHEAPEDVADWLDPATCGEGKIQEGMKDDRFKSLREGLVRTLAESSGKLAEIEALKLARKINHHKQVWSATWKLVARGCCHGVMELRCLVRTLLYRLRINGPSVSRDDLSVFADYARFLLVPSQASAW